MSKKIDRATHGPSWTEVILGAALSVILGVVLGAALLVFRPVVTKEVPKGGVREKGAVYYLEGSRDATKARQAPQKRAAFIAGQSVTVGEDELNALASPAPAGTPGGAKGGEKGKAPEKGKGAEKAAPAAPAAGDMIAIGAPNVRIRDGAMQVAVPVTINALDLGLKVIAQARGGFAKQSGGFVFESTELFLGSCPVQRLPFVSSYVRGKIIAGQPIPEDIKGAWAKLASVTIDGSTLKLTVP